MDPRFLPTNLPPAPGDFTLQFSGMYRLLTGLVCTAAGGFFIFIGGILLRTPGDRGGAQLFGVVFALAGACLLVLAWLGLLRTRLEKRGDRITLFGIFSSRSLSVPEINGFRQLNKGYYLLRARPGSGLKDIRVSPSLNGFEGFKDWAEKNLTNDDAKDSEREDAAALLALGGGPAAQVRYASLKKQWAVISGLSFALAAGGIFSPAVFQTAGALALALAPFVVLALVARSPGAVRLSGARKGGAPKAATALIFLFLASGLQAMMHFRIADMARIFTFSVPLALFTVLALWWISRADSGGEKAVYVLLGLFGLFHAYGVMASANCLLDASNPTTFVTPVLSMRVSHGKSTSYYVRVAPWGPFASSSEESVSRSFYEHTNVADRLQMSLREGAIGARWYTFARIKP